MKLSREDLDWAASQGLLTQAQAELLWPALEARLGERGEVAALADSAESPAAPRFTFLNVAYYAGALLVMGAFGFFMSLAWESFGGAGLCGVASAYAVAFVLAGSHLWFTRKMRTPGGLLFTMAVAMTPLAVYGLERALGLWPQHDPGVYSDFYPYIRGGWLFMEAATIVAGLIALYFVRFPFITAPIAFALWFMSMDVVPIIAGGDHFGWHERLWISFVFGMVVIAVAFLIDHRTREDYAFWVYLFGLLAFWSGAEDTLWDPQAGSILFLIVSLCHVALSIWLDRRTFIVFGALGLFQYLGYLSYEVFHNSILFPFALSGLGLLIIYCAVKYQRNQERIERAMRRLLPTVLDRYRPGNRPAVERAEAE